MQLEFADADQVYTYFPTPLLSLNIALGDIRGVRSKSILQLLAAEKSGKTSLALQILAESQRSGALNEISVTIGKQTRTINAVFIDSELQLDYDYARALGVDTAKVLVIRSHSAEEIADQIHELLKAGIKIILFDSITSITTRTEFEKDMDAAEKMAAAALFLSGWLKKLIHYVHDADALMIFINQRRANISTMSRSETKAWGPHALRYYTTQLITMARIKNDEGVAEVKLTVEKNKQGAEGNQTTAYLMHGQGFDTDRDVIELALQFGIVKKAGAWFKYGDVQAQGMRQCKEKFDMNKIRAEVMKAVNE